MTTPPFSIANFCPTSPYLAGPMVHISHIIFRKLLESIGGPGLLFTEMLDARRVVNEERGQNPWLERGSIIPTFYQLMVYDIDVAVSAVQRLVDEGVAGIDINMGCPAPKIKQMRGGVMLMKDPRHTAKLVAALRQRTKGPLTAKIRTGFQDDIQECVNFARMLELEGIDAITLHPRIHNQKLKSRARWEYIPILKASLQIPVIGNGDIDSADEAIAKKQESQADAIMIARQCAIQPWIFQEIEARRNQVPLNQILALDGLWMEFAEACGGWFNTEEALLRLGKWTYYFAKNFPFGHHLWTTVQNAPDLATAIKAGRAFFDRNQRDSKLPLTYNP